MRFSALAGLFAVLLLAPILFAADSRTNVEAAARLQVFLDRAGFAPGKIDGRYGEFTMKALALYRQSKGESAEAPEKSEGTSAAPDVTGLDLASIEPVFTTYTVTEADLQSVGELPEAIPQQAKQKSLPYRSAAEAIAEKFHTDVDFLAELNPGKTQTIKAGDTLTVPNVQPFELAAVKPPDEKSEGDKKAQDSAGKENMGGEKEAEGLSIQVDTKSNMLSVFEGGKLIGAYPVTVGSERTKAPVGEWKVDGIAKMPDFRWDKAMLERGERSDDFYLLPPGPNSPVGVMWIQLNKKGIGLHGTSEPDTIGRSESHGCVRLANWDIVRLAEKIQPGVPVVIR